MSNSKLLVQGEILIEETAQSFVSATAYVRLEDVSCIDDSSRIIGQQIIQNVSHTVGTPERLEIRLYGQISDEKASYAVSVHIDVDNDGQVSRGDYISMESYPVLTFGYLNQVFVRVRRVS
jgi:uncharacterized lipoprotein YbaY